jgi:hypothetical protein
MPTPSWTRIVIGLAAVAWALILLVTGDSLKASWAQPVGLAASIVVLVLLAYDRWVWRWRALRRLTRRPVLHGTWRTELRTSYGDCKDEVIQAYLVIRQTYSRILVAMLFDRSRSNSMSAELVVEDGRWVLHYLFRSEKQVLYRDGNPPARGAAQLTVAKVPKIHLEGDYWMEHGTRGQVRTVGYNRAICDTYHAADNQSYG